MRKNNSLFVFAGFIISLLVFIGCKKDGDTQPEIIDYKNLGYGYDFFDEYAKPDKVKNMVILDQAKLAEKGYIYYDRVDVTDVSSITGSSLEEYRSKFAQSLGVSGSYKGFTASIDASFSKETYRSSEYSFATYRSYTLKRKIGINSNVTTEQLKECLTDQAISDIDNLDPVTLFTKYGTHVIADFKLGGSLDFHFSANMNSFSSTTDIGVAASVGYESAMGGGSVSTSTEVANEINEKSSEVSMRLKAVGGNSTYGAAIAVDKDNSENYASWAASFDDESAWMLYDFDRLIPISDFASSDVRKSELETAFDTWATDRDQIQTDPSTGTLIIKAYGIENHDVEDQTGDAEFIWKIVVKDNEGTRHEIAVNTAEKTAKKCGKDKFLTFGNYYLKDAPYYYNSKTVTIDNVKIGTGISFSIFPLLEESDGSDLGTPGSKNNIYAEDETSITAGPEYVFEQSGSEWQFSEIIGGCTAAKKDGILTNNFPPSSSVNIPKGESKKFILILRQNDGSSNDEYMAVYMSVAWE